MTTNIKILSVGDSKRRLNMYTVYEYKFQFDKNVRIEDAKKYIEGLYNRQVRNKEYDQIQFTFHYPYLVDEDGDYNSGWRSGYMTRKGENIDLDEIKEDSDGQQNEYMQVVDAFIILLFNEKIKINTGFKNKYI